MAYSTAGYRRGQTQYLPWAPQTLHQSQLADRSKPHTHTQSAAWSSGSGATPPLSKRPAPAKDRVLSSQTSLSSTPHAPRQRKPLVLPRHGRGGTLPSTHSLLQQHSFLDEHLITTRSPPSPGLEEKMRECSSREERLLLRPREAWGEGPPQELRVVKPFRRVSGHKAPEGVPLLDLRRLNEPDEAMEPIELLNYEDVDHSTHRSQISWGQPPMPPPSKAICPTGQDTTDGVLKLEDGPLGGDLRVQDVTGETARQEGEGEEVAMETEEAVRKSRLEPQQFDFVEQKLLSHERSKPSPPSPAPSPLPTTLFGAGGAIQTKPKSAMFRSHMTLGMGAAETGLSRRLRFEARVLTQNGRDVHRELCGFYFLADHSLAVYEFRQFGKKSSALPMIQRGVYTHQIGHRRGNPFEINFIRKGATLHFPTSAHPSLPDSLRERPLLTLRVTHVDERAKRDLLCEGRNPMERRSIETYLNQPLSPTEEKENNLLQTLQGMLRDRLRGRASRTLVGLGRHLGRVCGSGGVVGRTELQQALRTFHVSLTHEDFGQLWGLVCGGHWGPPGGEGVYRDGCVTVLVGEMGEDRKSLVRKVFQKLDGHRSGSVSLSEVKKFFNASGHPDVLAGRRSMEEVWFGLFGYLHTRDHTTIDYADFEHYYEGVSIETQNDTDFYTLLKNCWTV